MDTLSYSYQNKTLMMYLIRPFVILILLFSVSVNTVQAQESKSTNESTEFVQIILYGQSLGMGWESGRAITTTAVDGNYMIGDNVLMQYNNDTKVLNPLVATRWNSGGEQPIVSCVNAFSEVYRNEISSDQKFIGMTGGHGGQTIERLSKECTNDGYYTSTFGKILDNTLIALDGKTVSCPAILYMQGEHNSIAWRAAGKGLTPGSNGTTDKTEYKDLLLTLKNNMQADIMSKYNQTEKPIFFIYQTSGGYISSKEMPIVMAQIEFANENDDVVLMNPHYALPDYSNGHLSTNGYRWYGQYMAKTLTDVLINENSYETLKPTNFNIIAGKIRIDYSTPVAPLVLDTQITPKQTDYGFSVYKNNILQTIDKIEIIDGTSLELSFNTRLTGNIEIVYAGNATNGSGNLRDSDPATSSTYTYFDDSGDSKQESYTPIVPNSSIYGNPYGLQNWSDQFYHAFDVSGTGLNYSYYEGTWNDFPDFDVLTPVATGLVDVVDLTVTLASDSYGLVFDGYIEIPSDATYTFYTNSDEGSRLFIDESLVVDNGDLHTAEEKSGSIELDEGYHQIKVEYFEKDGAKRLIVMYESVGITKQNLSNLNSFPVLPQLTQVITFPAIPVKTFGDAAFDPGATSNSDLPLTYHSSNPSVATIVNGEIQIINAGTSTITASSGESVDYHAAQSITQVLTVNKANQEITFAAISDKTVGDPNFDPGAVSSSGLPITYWCYAKVRNLSPIGHHI